VDGAGQDALSCSTLALNQDRGVIGLGAFVRDLEHLAYGGIISGARFNVDVRSVRRTV
jgi:hypothetical protein